jgi:hypothetical protein
MPAKAIIQHRRDTAANWIAAQAALGSSPLLASGEIAYETDTKQFKIGDGTSLWGALPYRKGTDGADAPTILGFNDQTSTSYTLVLSDKNKVVTLANASPITLTVPTDSSAPFEIGTTVNLLQAGAGQVTVVGASGVSVRSTPGLKLRAQWSSASLYKWKTNEWILSGDTVL